MKRLRLEQIKGFNDITLNFMDSAGAPRTCCAIVGDNGTGKSTLLQAISVAALGPAAASKLPGRPAFKLLRNQSLRGAIEAEFELRVDPFTSTIHTAEAITVAVGIEIDRSQEDFRILETGRMRFGRLNAAAHFDALRRSTIYQWGLCCGYGAFRGLRERADAAIAAAIPTSGDIDRVLSLFQAHSTLLDPLALEGLVQNGDVAAFGAPVARIPLGIRDRILEMFENLIPGLRVESSPDGPRQLFEQHGETRVTALTALSDGANSMIGLLGHLVRHGLELNGWKSDPLAASGIVLIDEVDLHLHPAWQRRALAQLQSAFPHVQFIVTTHSPLVLGGVPDGRVTVLRRSDDGNVVAMSDAPSVKGWRVDQLLTGLHFETFSYDMDTEQLSVRYGRLLSDPTATPKMIAAAEKELTAQKAAARDSDAPDRRASRMLDAAVTDRLNAMDENARTEVLAELITSYPPADDVPD